MQFKKHFSSNLQSLYAKQTVVLQPPPHLEPSLFSPSAAHPSPFTNAGRRDLSRLINSTQDKETLE